MIETKQYKNSTLSPISTSAVVGHIGSDTYTISFTIDITSVLEELNRLGRTNNKTLLTVNASEYYNDSVELRPYASYGSVEVPVSILKGEKTYIEFDLTNAIDAYVSGTFTINFGVNVIGVDTSLEPASPYTAYLTVYTENSTSINSLPLIFYRKKDMAHSSIKSEYIRLPLSYGGESIIDMFDLNVKHVVPLFDMNIGTINYPFSLIYNKLDRTNNSYVDAHLPYGWKTSLDMNIKKSDTFDSPLGDKTLYFYDPLNNSHKLTPIWYFYLNNTKTYVSNTNALYVNSTPDHEGEIWVHYNSANYKAYVEIMSEDGYRFLSSDIETEPIINYYYRTSNNEQDEFIVDPLENKIALDSQGKFSYIISKDENYRIINDSYHLLLEKKENGYFTTLSSIDLNNNAIVYHVNNDITNTYTYSLSDSNISSITFNISESESKTVNFTYSLFNITKVSNSFTEENGFLYNDLGYLNSFNYRNKIDEIGNSLSISPSYNIPISSYLYRYGNKTIVFEFNSNTQTEYIFNPDSSLTKKYIKDLDTLKEYVDETPKTDKYTKASLSLEPSDAYMVYSKNSNISSGYEVNIYDSQGTGFICSTSFLKVEPLILEIDLSNIDISNLMCNSLSITISPYNNGYDSNNEFSSYIYTLYKEKYYIPFFYKVGDTKIKISYSYSRFFSSSNIGKIKVYRGDASYTKLNSSLCPVKSFSNSGIEVIDYTSFNKISAKTAYDRYYHETYENYSYDSNLI